MSARNSGLRRRPRHDVNILHPGCIQSNVIEHIMRGRSYGWARRRVHWAIDTGLIVARRDGNLLYLYPPGPGGQEAGRDG
jgi:hypothetical protein